MKFSSFSIVPTRIACSFDCRFMANRTMKLLHVLVILLSCYSCRSDAQTVSQVSIFGPTIHAYDTVNFNYFDLPIKIKPYLSGNFAEIRSNHFHSGIDFKTQQRSGIPIYAPADGWVSRFRRESFGFGLALYLDHPNGFTTVYAHLQQLAPSLDSILKKLQYERETFALDTLFSLKSIFVKKGELIAYSGNSGVSSAPHLHFEIRETISEKTVDPLLWLHPSFADTKPPRINQLAIYAMSGKGGIGNKQEKMILHVVKDKTGKYVLSGKPTAWGLIGLGINAYDYMDGTSNIYGIADIKLYKDDSLIFHQNIHSFSFDETRYVNTLIDFAEAKKSKRYFMKSFIDKGNRLAFFPHATNRGLIQIDSAKNHAFYYVLTDIKGNAFRLDFQIEGKPQAFYEKVPAGDRLSCEIPQQFFRNDFKLFIPVGALYEDLYIQYKQEPSKALSDLYHIHNGNTPLHKPAQAWFRIQKDTLQIKNHYYLVKKNADQTTSRIQAIYQEGWMKADIKEFGSYFVLSDTIPPKISLLGLENVSKNNVIRIRISDAASGIQSWEGNIDGAWVLFELDGKTGMLTCQLNRCSIRAGINHQLKLRVTDACGNTQELTRDFFW